MLVTLWRALNNEFSKPVGAPSLTDRIRRCERACNRLWQIGSSAQELAGHLSAADGARSFTSPVGSPTEGV